MILGMSTATFTQLHVIISLIAILSGLIVLYGMLGARRMPGMTALFLATTVLTSVTGFAFPTPADAPRVLGSLDPAKVIGAISLILLALAILALYSNKLAGSWRGAYVISAFWWCRHSRKSSSSIPWHPRKRNRRLRWPRPRS
jgi:hypothetical protein